MRINTSQQAYSAARAFSGSVIAPSARYFYRPQAGDNVIQQIRVSDLSYPFDLLNFDGQVLLISFNDGSEQSAPEPGTLALFGPGLLGFAASCCKSSK